MKLGKFKIIKVDGTETIRVGLPTCQQIAKIIGCDTLDTVTLNRDEGIIMLVDDTGMLEGKPVNPKATELYHSVCKPGTTHQIHGDVAIC